MKQILLLRHAKSSWDNPDLKDFDRPLATRGQKDAPRMGTFLKKAGYLPGATISSPAQRAKETTQLCIHAAELDEDLITWNEKFYYGGTSDYLQAIKKAPERTERILLVGHNPSIEEVAGKLCGENTSIRMPTAALACFEQSMNQWDQLNPSSVQLKWMMIPKVVKHFL